MTEQTKIEKKWVEDDDYDDDADVVKLNVGESIEGLLIEKKQSETFGFIYKIQVKGKDLPQIVCGCTILNRKMANKEVGKEIRIVRSPDVKTLKGRFAHDYKTFHSEEQ